MPSPRTGFFLVLFVLLAASSASASVIANPALLPPSVPWEFSTATNTFSHGDGSAPTLLALFDDLGTFVSGTFEMRGPGNVLLLHGAVTGPPNVTDHGTHFLVVFDLDFDVSSPQLGFTADFGYWEAYVCNATDPDCDGRGPSSAAGVFTTDYADASFPVHNYIYTFAIVPSPAALVLLGLGCAILAACHVRRARR